MNLRNMLRRLTWNYRKDEDSNIYKLFATLAPEIESLKAVFEKAEAWQGIQNAEGSTLDLIGEDVRQERQGRTDEEYRPMLRFRTAVNRSTADINSVNSAFQAIMRENFVRLREGYAQEDYLEPASIIAEMKHLYPDMPMDVIDEVIAAGVRLIIEMRKQEELNLYYAFAQKINCKELVLPYRLRRSEKHRQYVAMHLRQKHKRVFSIPLPDEENRRTAAERIAFASKYGRQWKKYDKAVFKRKGLIFDGGSADTWKDRVVVEGAKIWKK